MLINIHTCTIQANACTHSQHMRTQTCAWASIRLQSCFSALQTNNIIILRIRIYIQNIHNAGECVYTLTAHENAIMCLDFNKTSKLLLSASNDIIIILGVSDGGALTVLSKLEGICIYMCVYVCVCVYAMTFS